MRYHAKFLIQQKFALDIFAEAGMECGHHRNILCSIMLTIRPHKNR